MALVALGTGSAIAGRSGEGPLAGLDSGTPPRAPAAIDPATATALNAGRRPDDPVDQVGEVDYAKAIRVGALPSGGAVYAVPSKRGKLCVLAQLDGGQVQSCSEALTRDAPITNLVVRTKRLEGPLIFGVAIDGVVAVIFDLEGVPERVAVSDHVYAMQGPPQSHGGVSNVVAEFADGTHVAVGTQVPRAPTGSARRVLDPDHG